MMIKPNIKDYELGFGYLNPRHATDMIVIHHTGNTDEYGNAIDDDLSAEEIHEIHKGMGWSGIGYHFVVRKDGTIEQGRDMDVQGAHAQGENWHTIGIHVCSNFEEFFPTPQQIESVSYLVGWLAEYYGIECTADNVVGHRDLMATACPGQNLYAMLQDIRGKAIWYQQHYQGGD